MSGRTAIVIGGGAAGMMAASMVKAHAPNMDVLLFEKNPYLGAKILISGGGRCNVTTGMPDVREMLKCYPRGAKFLSKALYDFPPSAVMEWFESHGVPMKVEPDMRVFPRSDEGTHVVGALEADLKSNAVEIFCRSQVVDVSRDGRKFSVRTKNDTMHEVDYLVITTGGSTYQMTGSSGDGYAFAKKLGHTITPLAPSLHAFVVGEKWISEIAGVSFQRAHVSLSSSDGMRTYVRTGPILFTHRGISGPAIFALSSISAFEKFGPEHPLKLAINFFPEQSSEQFRKRLHTAISQHGKKKIDNLLDMFLPKSLAHFTLRILALSTEGSAAHLNKDMRDKICVLLQQFPLTLTSRSAGEEFVTAGGVCLDEVDKNTMESKLRPGLYFAGEILDIDGFTGGFNLQAAWATGAVAGRSLARRTASRPIVSAP